MSDTIDKVFHLESERVAILEQARIEQKELGMLTPETERKIALFAENKEDLQTQLGRWFLNRKARLEGKKAQYAPILETIRAEIDELEDQMEFVRDLLGKVTPGDEVLVNDDIYILSTPSERLQVNIPVSEVPIEYTRIRTEIDTEKVKSELEAGVAIDWAIIEKRYNVQVKPGGEKARRNAKALLRKREKGVANGE